MEEEEEDKTHAQPSKPWRRHTLCTASPTRHPSHARLIAAFRVESHRRTHLVHFMLPQVEIVSLLRFCSTQGPGVLQNCSGVSILGIVFLRQRC